MQHHLIKTDLLKVVFMGTGKRLRLSATEKTDIWTSLEGRADAYMRSGAPLASRIATIRSLLLPRGGIPPVARRRSRLALTRVEREDISRGIASAASLREIARHLDRAASTVSREVTRHGGRPIYRAHEADDQAWKVSVATEDGAFWPCTASYETSLRVN